MTYQPETSRREFAAIMSFLSVALGVTVDAARQETYYVMLGDIDPSTLMRAVREIVATRPYPTLPTIGEIRKRAQMIRLKVAEAPHPVEAWSTVLALVRKFHLDHDKFETILAAVDSPHLREFLRRFGRANLFTLAYSDDGEWERSRFERAYAAFLEHQSESGAIALPDSFSGIPKLVRDICESLRVAR